MLLCGAAVGVAAQINFLGNAITFRTTSLKTELTTHYGLLSLAAITAAGGYALLVQNECTFPYAPYGPYGIYAISTAATSGTGGRFDGKTYGVLGIASLSGSTDHYGAYFNGAGSTGWNYGILSSASGTNRWAGWFNGDVYCNGQYQGSDARLKMDVQNLSGSLEKLLKLQPRQYLYDTAAAPSLNLPAQKQYGFVAQELQPVFPELVRETQLPATPGDTTATGEPKADGSQTTMECVNYVGLVPVLVQAIQEQQQRIAALEAKVEQMTGR